MQPLGTPCLRQAWAVVLAAVAFINPSWGAVLAPANLRVDFGKHGSDWVMGQCASRKKQSPIDLNELFKPPGGTFEYSYNEVSGEQIQISNDGRMLSTSLPNSSFASMGGLALELRGEQTWFNLTSIDVKSVSEHTLRGKHYPLEIQLVHRPHHFYAQGDGPESVTVSIFVDSPQPPKSPRVWPGLLQKTGGKMAPKQRKLRGQAASLMQQSPAMMPNEAGVDPADEEEGADDPANQRMDSEVNFVRTLVEGEDALGASPAGAPAAAPGGAPGAAEDEEYVVPSPMDPNFNPLLQFLVEQEPPNLDTEVNTGLGPGTPLQLGKLLAGGTYFYYWGSETLPPCAEKDLWLIKREVVQASNAQVEALYSTLHLMSGGAGNFRTSMPLNQRAVQVLAGKEGIPRSLQPAKPFDLHSAEPHGQEEKYITMAKDAITIAKAASDYAKDMDWRIQAGSSAHLRAMEELESTTPAPTTSAFIPAPPNDQIWATKIMSDIVKKGIHDAMQANIDEMIPATVSLAGSYIRQRVLKKANFGPPPVGAKVIAPKPIPGVPTFFPPESAQMPSKQNMSDMADLLAANNCTAAANFSGCGSITGLTAEQATALSNRMSAMGGNLAAAGTDAAAADAADGANGQMTPEQVPLPPGVTPVPADWPDEEGWPNGLPPANWPTGADPTVWPNPDGAKPSGFSDYQWERYKYNWGVYRSSYQPYRSSYSGYSISRRRRASSYSSRRRSSRSSYSSRRRSSSSYSSRRRSSRSSYSSRRRRGR